MIKWIGYTLSIFVLGLFTSGVHAQDDAANPIPSLEEVVPVPSLDYFFDEYHRMIANFEGDEAELQIQFFIGKKYRYCQVIPVAYRVVQCKDCSSRGIGGEGGRAYCGYKCNTNCSVRYGKCSESRNRPPCP